MKQGIHPHSRGRLSHTSHTTKRNFLRALIAVLAGNAIYFALLMPRLPAGAQHRIGALDLGLLLDFLICGALYVIVALLDDRNLRQQREKEQC